MRAVVLINFFEVPSGADDRFIEGWEEARDFLRWKDGFLGTALHRNLAPATFRFVSIAEITSVDAWRGLLGDPDFPGRNFPFPAHSGLYEVLFEDGGIGTEATVQIDAFDVPADHEEAAFTDPWQEACDYLAPCPGYLGTRLHRCIGTADFRFVNVGWWQSAEACGRALDDSEFAARMPYAGTPGLYEVIRR